MTHIDESQIIDRDAEIEVFNSMLRYQTPRRVLVVSDKSGMGKSDVLRKLRYLCEFTHHIPVALIDLRVFASRPDVFKLVLEVQEALRSGGAAFPTFDVLNSARAFQDTNYFLEQMRTVHTLVDTRGAHIDGQARVAGIMFNVERADNVHLPPWNEQAETEAQSLCREAFLVDLLQYATERPVVLLFDTVDKASEELRHWLFLELISRRLLRDWQHHRLVVVLAGQGIAEILKARLRPEEGKCIEPIATLSRWEIHHVREFLMVHGFRNLSDGEVSSIHTLLGEGRTLSCALMVAELLASEVHA